MAIAGGVRPDLAVWDPEVLARVRHLHLRARRLTDAMLMGEHRSRRVGQAVEFADYQEYLPGMDLRHLDWRVLARSDRLVVRRFETETQLPCTLVLDLSGDLLPPALEVFQALTVCFPEARAASPGGQGGREESPECAPVRQPVGEEEGGGAQGQLRAHVRLPRHAARPH